MADFHDKESFEEWLFAHPREVAVGLSARAALRALPFSAELLREDSERWAALLILPQFRAIATPWFVGTWPNQSGGIRPAAVAAAASAAAAAAFSSSVAASPAFSAAAAAARSAAAAAAARPAAAAAVALSAAAAPAIETQAEFWKAVSTDADSCDLGQSIAALVGSPLWTENPPDDILKQWTQMRETLIALKQGWQTWANWYEARLQGVDAPHGRPLIMELERDRILMPTEADWEEGPAHVNAVLTDLEYKYRSASEGEHDQRDTVSNEANILEDRLRALAPRQAHAIAIRSSLRTLPLHDALTHNAAQITDALFPHCRSVAVACIEYYWPSQLREVQAAAYAARAHASVAADTAAGMNDLVSYYLLRSAYQAIDSASAKTSSAGPGATMSSLTVHDLAHLTDSEGQFFGAAVDDLRFFESGGSYENLIQKPLWSNGMPQDILVLWLGLKDKLTALNENWEVWTNWYEDRLWGTDNPQSRPLIMALERDRIRVPSDEDWKQGPAQVNDILAELEDRYRRPGGSGGTEGSPTPPDDPPFVFISYKREDEADARALRDALALLGIETWWDKDIPADVNFRSHIAERLEDAGCVLTLWSQAALHSDWLQEEAERGRQRNRLVQLTLDGTTPLPPFSSRQILDLSHWNGDPQDAAFQRIIDGIRFLLRQGGHGGGSGAIPARGPRTRVTRRGNGRGQPAAYDGIAAGRRKADRAVGRRKADRRGTGRADQCCNRGCRSI